MGLDVIVIAVIMGLTIRGYCRGFLKGSGALMTPVVALWLCLRYAHKLSFWFKGATGNASASLALAILVILIVSFIGVQVLRKQVSRLFDRLRMWDVDGLLGGALGLFQATVVIWILIAFVFIAYPEGRPAIERAPISAQILLFGEDVPYLRRKMGQADRCVKEIAKPLDRLRSPTLPAGVSAPADPKAIDGLDLGNDWR
jgi:hypothetical protein